MARLVLDTPEGKQVVDLRPYNTLGRHPGNSIQVLDRLVSKEHCVISQQELEFVLRDLDSLNGTFVNGERLTAPHTLKNGDRIGLGSPKGEISGIFESNTTARVPEFPQQPPTPYPHTGFGTSAWHNAGIPPRLGGPLPVAPGATQPIKQALAAQQVNRQTGGGTRIDLSDAMGKVGEQVDATALGFLPYDRVAQAPQQLAQDYERLRLSYELSREIALERDLNSLLNKILMSVFRFIDADRGVIFLKDETGELVPGASLLRSGATDAITVSSTMLRRVMDTKQTVLTHDAPVDFQNEKSKSLIMQRISSAIVAPLLHKDQLLGVLWLDSHTLAKFQVKDLELVTAIAAQAAMFIEINILGKQVEQEIVAREHFSRLLSPNVAEKVMSGEMVIKQGGQLVENCTVFNSDIRGFTQMSEGADPQAIVEMLNQYFEAMVESIFDFDGTLDKFMGDGIMALWGAPGEHPDNAYRSVCCALDQMARLEQFNRERAGSNLPALSIGVGIHTGRLVSGYIGSSRALSYTVIGDTANTSARLCGVAQPGQILVSQATLDQLGGRFAYTKLPAVSLKGKSENFPIFQINARNTSVAVPETVGAPTDR